MANRRVVISQRPRKSIYNLPETATSVLGEYMSNVPGILSSEMRSSQMYYQVIGSHDIQRRYHHLNGIWSIFYDDGGGAGGQSGWWIAEDKKFGDNGIMWAAGEPEQAPSSGWQWRGFLGYYEVDLHLEHKEVMPVSEGPDLLQKAGKSAVDLIGSCVLGCLRGVEMMVQKLEEKVRTQHDASGEDSAQYGETQKVEARRGEDRLSMSVTSVTDLPPAPEKVDSPPLEDITLAEAEDESLQGEVQEAKRNFIEAFTAHLQRFSTEEELRQEAELAKHQFMEAFTARAKTGDLEKQLRWSLAQQTLQAEELEVLLHVSFRKKFEAEIQQQAQAHEQEVNKLMASTQGLQDDLVCVKAELQTAQAENQRRTGDHEQELTQLQEKLAEVSAALAARGTTAAQYEDELVDARAQLAEMKAMMADAQAEINDTRAQLASAQGALQSSEAAQLEAQHTAAEGAEGLRDLLTKSKEELQQTRDAQKALQEEAEMMREELSRKAEVENEVALLRDQLARAEEQLQQADTAAANEVEVAAMHEEFAKVKAELRRITEAYEAATQECSSLQKELKSARANGSEELRKDNEFLQEQLRNAHEDLKALKQSAEVHEEELQEAVQRAGNMQDVLSKHVVQLEAQVQQETMARNDAVAEMEMLKSELAAHQEAATEQVQAAEKSRRAAEVCAEELGQRIEELQSQIEQQIHAQLKSTLLQTVAESMQEQESSPQASVVLPPPVVAGPRAAPEVAMVEAVADVEMSQSPPCGALYHSSLIVSAPPPVEPYSRPLPQDRVSRGPMPLSQRQVLLSPDRISTYAPAPMSDPATQLPVQQKSRSPPRANGSSNLPSPGGRPSSPSPSQASPVQSATPEVKAAQQPMSNEHMVPPTQWFATSHLPPLSTARLPAEMPAQERGRSVSPGPSQVQQGVPQLCVPQFGGMGTPTVPSTSPATLSIIQPAR